MQSQFNAVAVRAEAAEAATRASDHQLEAAQARAAALQRDLAAAQAEGGRMSGLAAGADAAASAAERRMRALEMELAKAHAHIGAVEGSLTEVQVRGRVVMMGRIALRSATSLQTRAERIAEEVSVERNGRITAEAERDAALEELARRPPLDSIKELELESLLQRNMEAAAAVQLLLQQTRGAAAGGHSFDAHHTSHFGRSSQHGAA